MVLYGTYTSPFVRKVRLALHFTGLAKNVEFRLVETNPTIPNLNYAQKNPLMRVPALELENGMILADSKLICRYLDELSPNTILPTGHDKWRVESRHFLADGALDSAVLIRYEEALRPKEKLWPEWIKGQEEKIRKTLSFLQGYLDEMKDRYYLDSLALHCLLGYLKFRGICKSWEEDFPKLADYYTTNEKKEAFCQTAPDYAQRGS
ncbi:MAG: glutathione S-transferase N-terminal domain-containing protein [Leptospiraceae bacterium]|nr:glutathione S-transferase N-terminal domain-containing protein [Leptospiraceae bacterium]MDW8306457.1 glutathione S-transferase N-terminal domain-containing protein [Leptospiraceae bacterium]